MSRAINAIVETRNDLAHLNRISRGEAELRQLWAMLQTLLLVLEYELLTELGFPADAAGLIVHEGPRMRLWAESGIRVI